MSLIALQHYSASKRHRRLPVLLAPAAAVVTLFSCAAAQAQVAADRLRASVTLASDFVQYGLLQTNNEPSLRFSLDYEHDSGFFAGGSVANVDYLSDRRLASPRDTQAIVYAGYQWRRNQWLTNVNVSHYSYPDFERDYDFSQMSASVSYRDRYFLTVTHSNNYLDLYDSTRQATAGIAFPWIQNLELSASAGYLSYKGRRADTFSYWDIGLSRPFQYFAVDFRYHDNSLGRNSIAGNMTHNEFVFSMTWSLLPQRPGPDRR